MPSSPHPDVTERRAKIAARAARGVPPHAIAKELGVSYDVVRQDLHRILLARKKELDEYRDILIAAQVEELDQVRMVAWRNATMKHYQVSLQSGKVALDPESGQPLLDTGPVDRALALIVKVQERLSKLLALDEPTKINVKAEVVSVDTFRVTVEELRERVARERAAGGVGGAAGGVRELTAGTGGVAGEPVPGELPPEATAPGSSGASPS